MKCFYSSRGLIARAISVVFPAQVGIYGLITAIQVQQWALLLNSRP
jgi:hypothetical protein